MFTELMRQKMRYLNRKLKFGSRLRSEGVKIFAAGGADVLYETGGHVDLLINRHGYGRS